MMLPVRTSSTIALCLGVASLALILGALGFEYIGRMPPCEMCMWQRYPHFAAIVVGIGGFILARTAGVPDSTVSAIAVLTALFIAVSGAIGVYHAGVEWHWWQGPEACTGPAFHGVIDLSAPVVRCDQAAWRLFGISLAGYNAILSLAIAAAGVYFVGRTRKPS